MPYHIVVCGSIVPDPLQTLEPVPGERPALKNEAMLPAVLDPWAAHSLYEAANLAKQVQGSKVYLVSMGPRAKLQQLMMTVAQKVSFELVAIDGSAGYFKGTANVDSRSWMNVDFKLPTPELDAKFVSDAKAAGIIQTKGYRTMGGIRLSCYNAVSLKDVQTTVQFMQDFKAKNPA